LKRIEEDVESSLRRLWTSKCGPAKRGWGRTGVKPQPSQNPEDPNPQIGVAWKKRARTLIEFAPFSFSINTFSI
jgi:hypothetical protein